MDGDSAMTEGEPDSIILLFLASSKQARKLTLIGGIASILLGPITWIYGLIIWSHAPMKVAALDSDGAPWIVIGFVLTLTVGPALLYLWVKSALLAATMSRLVRKIKNDFDD